MTEQGARGRHAHRQKKNWENTQLGKHEDKTDAEGRTQRQHKDMNRTKYQPRQPKLEILNKLKSVSKLN